MRASIRRPRAVVLAALASAFLIGGVGGCAAGRVAEQPAAADTREVFLEPVADQGPDPFTASTAASAAPTPSAPSPSAPAPSPTSSVLALREITGSTPGLYGGTRSVGSCDVEQQVAFLAAEPDKARAFAEAAGVNEANLASWLRGLTPVLLRADTRVTNHGFRDGVPNAFQSVLQAGTAVLVDQYGAPRVRCACGNPLRSPIPLQDAKPTGKPWAGYRPDRVIVIEPTTMVINNLIIVDVVNDTWIQRETGTDGDQDREPVVVPPCDPDECDIVTDPPTPLPDPSDSGATTSPPPATPESPDVPDGPATPEPPSPEDLFPSGPNGQDGGASPVQPETFEG